MKSATDSDIADFDITVAYEAEQFRKQRSVSVYITVTAREQESGPAAPDAPPEAPLAEVILLDRSGSMSWPKSKLEQAKRAGRSAVDLLRDGTQFAIVAGTHKTYMVYPREHFLAPATAATRAEAMRAIDRIDASGEGTAIGAWLDTACELLKPHLGSIKHAILLTDGKNQHQDQMQRSLETVLTDCRGVFTCDARGIGADWEPEELERIAQALQGTSDAVPEYSALEDAFRSVIRTALSRVVPEVALRVRCAPGVRVTMIEQDDPVIADLAEHGRPVAGTPAVDYSMGPWSHEQRSYSATFQVDRDLPPRGEVDSIAVIEVVTGRIGTVRAEERAVARRVDVTWVDIEPPLTRLDAASRRHRRDVELKELRVAGGRRFKHGDRRGAVQKWGEAFILATELRNAEALERLRSVLQVTDAASGRFELHPRLDGPDAMTYVNWVMSGNASSTRSAALDPERGQDQGPDGRHEPGHESGHGPARVPKPAGPGKRCGKCDRISVATAKFCEAKGCDYKFPET
jgi:von Willebrand factor type A domain